jgi:hypothetical protein
MNPRLIDLEKDYKTLCEWWSGHEGWPAIPEVFLPKVGLIVDGLCAGFLYQTDSGFAWLEWVVGNPQADKEARSEALDLLVKELLRVAKELGFQAVFSAIKHPGLLERYEKFGFNVTDRGMNHGIWRI